MFEHLERLRNKPHHVRRNIALGSAGALTALLAVGWLTATIAGGSLALQPVPLDPTGATAAIASSVSDTSSSFSQLLGAVGAATGISGSSTAPQLQIVDGAQSSTLAAKVSTSTASSQTVIPF
jgi:hypothetical protein